MCSDMHIEVRMGLNYADLKSAERICSGYFIHEPEEPELRAPENNGGFPVCSR